jgi:hypothetical protein
MKGVQGNFAAQVRILGHDAVPISASATQIADTEDRGVCLYIGTGGSVQVKMEGTMGGASNVTFQNVPDGHFLPILVTHLIGGTASNILAIY